MVTIAMPVQDNKARAAVRKRAASPGTTKKRGRPRHPDEYGLVTEKIWTKDLLVMKELKRTFPLGVREPTFAMLFHAVLDKALAEDGPILMPDQIVSPAKKRILDGVAAFYASELDDAIKSFVLKYLPIRTEDIEELTHS